MTEHDGGPWLPDGQGLSELVLALVAKQPRRPVHLRLHRPDRAGYPRTACGQGLGDWWTGRADEVTCPGCLEWVHA